MAINMLSGKPISISVDNIPILLGYWLSWILIPKNKMTLFVNIFNLFWTFGKS
jgi:hypothetical protein